MSSKPLPFTLEQVREIAIEFPTPFHLYDEAAIRANARRLAAGRRVGDRTSPRCREYGMGV